MESSSVRAWQVEWDRLQKRQNAGEKEVANAFAKLRASSVLRKEEEEEGEEKGAHFTKFRSEIYDKLESLSGKVTSLKDSLRKLAEGHSVDAHLSNDLQAFEIDLEAYKKRWGDDFEILKTEERVLYAEMRALEAKFCFSEKSSSFSSSTKKIGGWDCESHESFMRVWVQCGNSPEFVNYAKCVLPDYTEAEIEKHAEWYVMASAKKGGGGDKNALKNEEEGEDTQIGDRESSPEQKPTKEEAEQKRREQESKRLLVRAWREEKERAAAEQLREEEEQRQFEKTKRDIADNERRLSMKRAVTAYRVEKERRHSQSSEHVVKGRRTPTTAAELELLAQKSLEFGEKKKKEREQREREARRREEEQNRLLSESGPSFHRRQSQVCDPTTSSRRKSLSSDSVKKRQEEKKKQGAHDATIAYTARDLTMQGRGQRRAVPSWRKGL